MTNYKRIEAYILGNLSENEIDLLWMAFIQDAELYQYFETELMLRSKVSQSGKKNTI